LIHHIVLEKAVLVSAASKAALAAGADGLMIEVHPEPHKS